nr:transporter substrate-binding domain-containing protein [Streptomyces sp. SID3343]
MRSARSRYKIRSRYKNHARYKNGSRDENRSHHEGGSHRESRSHHASFARAAALVAALTLTAACTSSSHSVAESTPSAVTTPSSPTTASASASVAPCGEPTASLRPAPGPPRAADYTRDGSLAQLQRKGYLTVGIDQSSYPFGYADVLDNELRGFDIDLVREIAKDLFGGADPEHLRFRVLPNAIREQSVADGDVDLVAKSVTINCERRAKVDFSSTYYEAGQQVLVLTNTPAAAVDHRGGLGALPKGTRMCTVAKTTAATSVAATPGLVNVNGENWNDCLIRLQQGGADASVGDDTIMLGLHAQDPHTELVGDKLSYEPYGLEISKDRPDLVRFVNASLQRIRQDGTWLALFDTYLAPYVSSQAQRTPPPAAYRD